MDVVQLKLTEISSHPGQSASAATFASDLYSAVVHRSDLGDNELPEKNR